MWPRIDGLRTLELGTAGQMRTRLNALVLEGTKQATCGLRFEDYDREGEAIEHVGEVLVLVDDANREVGRVEVTDIRSCRFGEITWEMAAQEGEGDNDLEEWRGGHIAYWKREEGLDVTDDTDVVWCAFRVLTRTS